MGFGLSRPQYSYIERLRPVEYFTTCDPSSCFCGITHTRERQLIASRGPGGQEIYRDPLDVMDGYLMGGRFGQPTMGIGMGMGVNMSPGLVSQPLMTAQGMMSTGMVPGISAGMMPGMSMPVQGIQQGQSAWPAEWKDASEWTTRDYDRLAQIMQELMNRYMGRGAVQFNPRQRRLSSRPSHNSGFVMEEDFDVPDEAGPGHSRARNPEFEQLQAQMMQFIAESQKQMQQMSDAIYGSERESREERHRERLRKSVEDILKTMTDANMTQSTGARPNPFAPQSPMGMVGGMSPFGMPMGMGPMMGEQDGWTGGPMPPRRNRRARGIGYGDGFDDMDRRRPRRSRLGFNDPDDDLFNLGGDDRHSPSRPHGPRRPRPDRGDDGGGAVYFDDGPKAESRGRTTRRDDRTVNFASPDRERQSEPDDLAAWTNARFPSSTVWPTSPPPMPPAPTMGSRTYTYGGTWPSAVRNDAPAEEPVNGYARPYPSLYPDRAQQTAVPSGGGEVRTNDGQTPA